MHKLRTLTVGIGALALATVASAQIDGPSPLAWRWIQPTSVSPTSSVLVSGDKIYQSVGGRVFALDKTTGNLKWRFPAVEPIPGTFRTSPIRTETNTVIAVGDNKIVYGINGDTGETKWSHNLPGSAFGQPVVVGKTLVIAQSDNKIYAIDTESGNAVWENPFNVLDGITGSLAGYGSNNVLFFSPRGELHSLNLAARKFDWKRAITQVAPNPLPVVQGDTVYLNSGPYLVSLNAATGLPRWQIATGMQLVHSPSVGTTGVMVVSQDGKVMVYDPVTRQALTKQAIDMKTLAAARPTSVGQNFIVPTTNGGLILIDPTAAEVKWNYVIRPIGNPSASTQNGGGAPTGGRFGSGGPGGPGGPGGGAPGGAPGGGLGGGLGGGQNQAQTAPVSVQAAAPAVLSGKTLFVTAKDGSILAFDSELGVDLTSPVVEMQFPNPGDQVSGQPPLLLVFKVSDEASGVNESTLKVQIDGKDVDYTLAKDGQIVVRFSQTGKNRSLTDGRKTISVIVNDWMGNVTKQDYNLTIDNSLRPIQLPGQNQDQQGGLPGGGRGGRGGGGGGGGVGRGDSR